MKTLLLSSLVFVFLIGIIIIPSANALPVSYNTTSINLGLTSVPRNSSSYDVFPLIPDNWLWEKFDNNTIDSGPLSVAGTVTYNTNLKLMLHFESSLVDAANGHNGAVTGATTYTNGHEGQGFSFNGASEITGSDASLPSGNSAFSASFWVDPTTVSGTQVLLMWGKNTAGQDVEIYLSGNKVHIDKQGTGILTSATSVSATTWTHIVVTFDATTLKIYFNGVLDGNTSTPTFGIVLTGYEIGGYYGNVSNLTGIMDEVRVYSGALSQAQVSALYEVGKYSQSHTFDGGEYVSLGNTFAFTNTTPFTISLWVNKPSGAGGGNELISKGGDGTGGYEIYYAGTTVFYRLWDGGGTHQITATATNGAYHYIAATWDGSSNFLGMKLYIDGVLQAQGTSSALGSFTVSTPVCIGVSCGDFANPTVGQIDNVKIYPYALSASQITTDMSLNPISSGKQFMSWYNGKSGSATLTEKLGTTKSSLTLACNLSNSLATYPVSNLTKIYYGCTQQIKHIDINSGTNTHDFTINNNPAANTWISIFFTTKNLIVVSTNGGGAGTLATSATSGNSTGYGISGVMTQSNQKLFSGTTGLKFNYNNTSPQTITTNQCEINFLTTNTTKVVDNIACDNSLPANTIRYWNGMMINRNANYAANSTQQFLSSIDANSYKKLLSLPCIILVNETPCVTFILTDLTQTDYFVVLTSTHMYYENAQTALSYLNTHNYAFQSYDIITQQTSSSYEIQNPILQSMKIYGPINFNVTSTKAGLFTLPSGYSVKTTSIESAIRTIDPRWTNDATDIPIITSTGSLFPIFLTVSNAPVFSAIKVTNPYQLINSQESVWAVAQLDSTRTVEFDLPTNVCVNIYVADISVSPSIWNFQGIICANGVNQKTISYTNTLPFTFWTYPWGASDSFTPNTNGLVTTVRHTTAPFSYNIILKNSTGTVFQNTTYTSNSTIDTQNFNLTGRAKPVSLYINSVTGGVNQIYSAFLGSPISLASTASFFNQYFSYQGFNLLAFIPIIFASMFTRNTIGIGVVLTVLCIATLSWLSVVVIPELDIMIMIVIAIIGLIAYRLTYY